MISDTEAAKVINDLYLSGKIAVYPNVKAIIANQTLLTQKQAAVVQIVNESLAKESQLLHPETNQILSSMMNRAIKREMLSGNDTEIFRP